MRIDTAREYRSVYRKRTHRESRRLQHWHSIYVTMVVIAMVVVCFILGDAVATPVSYAIGATPEQVKANSNLSLMREKYMLLLPLAIIIYTISRLMLGYLQHGVGDTIEIGKEKHPLREIF